MTKGIHYALKQTDISSTARKYWLDIYRRLGGKVPHMTKSDLDSRWTGDYHRCKDGHQGVMKRNDEDVDIINLGVKKWLMTTRTTLHCIICGETASYEFEWIDQEVAG